MPGPGEAVNQETNTERKPPPVVSDGQVGSTETALERESITRPASEALLGEYLSTGIESKASNDNRAPLTDASLPGLEIAQDRANPSDKVQTQVRELESSRAANTREIQQKSSGKAGDRAEYNLNKLLTDPTRGVMPELLREGSLGAEWSLYPTQSGSPADKIGGDFLLVNKQTGDFYLIDATVNDNKQNTFRLREEGIIKLDNRWFDTSGALNTDHPDNAIRQGAEGFRAELKQTILDLTGKQSPFKIGDMPMPQATKADAETTKAQVENVSKWAAEKAANPDTPNKGDYREMSDVVKRALTHQEKTAREVRSEPLRDKAKNIAKRDIANYIFHTPEGFKENYLGNKQGQPNKADVVVLKDGGVRLEHKGDNLHGGTTGEAIEAAMSELVKPGELLAQLNNTQLKKLGVSDESITKIKKLKGQAKVDAIADLIKTSPDVRKAHDTMSNRWYQYKGAIANEGNYGENRNALRDSIRLGLRNSESFQLTGEEPPQKSQPKVEKPLSIHERSPLGKEAIADLQRNFVLASGEHPGTAYSLDAHLALMEIVPRENWTEQQKQELTRLSEGYEAQDPKIIKEVNELVIPERAESGKNATAEKDNKGTAAERAGAENRAGEPVRTGQDHVTEALAERATAKPIDINVLVNRYNPDGTITRESKPLSKLSHEEMIRKFENIEQKIAEAKKQGQHEAAQELERHRDEFNRRTPSEKNAYIEQIRQEARAIQEKGSGMGGKFLKGSSTAVAVMMLLDFALPSASHADEVNPGRVVPRGGN